MDAVGDIRQFGFDMVGLSAQRPLIVSTLHYGGSQERWVRQSGDRETPAGAPRRDMRYLEIRHPRPDPTTPLHRHGFYEIALIRNGQFQHRTLQGRTPLERGDVLVMTPRAVHGYEQVRNVLYTNIYLYPLWLLDDLRILWGAGGLTRFLLADALFKHEEGAGLLHLRSTEEETSAWEDELQAMEAESREPQPSIVAFNGCFLKILALLNKAYMRLNQPPLQSLRPEIWAYVQRMEQMIARGDTPDIPALADELEMSPRNFSRIFKRATGWRPLEYFQYRRVMAASVRLSQDRERITDVAYDLGFSDTPHFSRLFKRYMGVSPREYQAQHADAQAPA